MRMRWIPIIDAMSKLYVVYNSHEGGRVSNKPVSNICILQNWSVIKPFFDVKRETN